MYPFYYLFSVHHSCTVSTYWTNVFQNNFNDMEHAGSILTEVFHSNRHEYVKPATLI